MNKKKTLKLARTKRVANDVKKVKTLIKVRTKRLKK